jgi:hypothetical protein
MMNTRKLMPGRTFLLAVLIWRSLLGADANVEKTIRDLYSSSDAAIREARTADDIKRALSTFAPEWVGNMPAGETLTLADLFKEGEAALAIPPEKRNALLPKMDLVYIRETGWNVLVVYWNSRRSGTRVVGSLYRDTWVRTADGWKRIRQEKFFSDRALIEDGKPQILPASQ